MAEIDLTGSERRAFVAALDAFVKARLEYANSFLRKKMMATPDAPVTDRQAEQMAIIETNDRVTLTGAYLELARKDLEQAIYAAKPASTNAERTH